MLRSTLTRLTRPAIATAAVLCLAVAGWAQTRQSSTSTWRDNIGPNDVRVLGKVAEVRDETFTLRAHDAIYIFQLPTDPEQLAAVRTGTDVQVWYDPAGYERDGDTFYRVSQVRPPGEAVEIAQSEARERELERLQTQQDAAADAARSAERERLQAQQDAAAQAARSAELERERVARAAAGESEAAARESAAREAERQAERDRREVLPQTAGALPLVALAGLIALLGAAALRLRSSSRTS